MTSDVGEIRPRLVHCLRSLRADMSLPGRLTYLHMITWCLSRDVLGLLSQAADPESRLQEAYQDLRRASEILCLAAAAATAEEDAKDAVVCNRRAGLAPEQRTPG